MYLRKLIFFCLGFVLLNSIFAEEKEARAMIWVSPGSPPGIWQKAVPGDAYPADLIMKTIADMGFTDVLWQANELRGKAACYPTKVEFMQQDPAYKGRDILEETLIAADKYDLKVWAVFTPGYQQPGTDIEGLNNPKMRKIYTDLIDELGRDYKPRHKSLYGVMQHEFNCAEGIDMHRDDVKEFSDFCEKEFGEKYTIDKIPSMNGNDIWQRRFYLYKADVMNKFCQSLADTASRWGLKNIFCLYIPENAKSNSAVWGYDIPAIEKFSDNMWVVANGGYYSSLRNPFAEVSVSYRGANLPMNFVNSFHGYPIAVFEVRSWLFYEAQRKHYATNKKWTEVSGDYYNGYFGRSEKAVELFQNKEYVKPLIALIKSWQNPEFKAEIGVLSSSQPFLLRFSAPGIPHEQYVKEIFNAIKKHYPVDIILLETEKALDQNWLKRYKVIVVPPETGKCMSPQMYRALDVFCKNGGKLISFSAQISTSKKDLTDEKDMTKELFGVDFDSKHLPGLTQNGNAYFFNAKIDAAACEELCKKIEQISPQSISLKNNKGFKIASALLKDSVLCVPLPAPMAASAELCLNTKAAGLAGDSFMIKDMMTGTVIKPEATRAELLRGIKIATEYDSQPLVLAVGSRDGLEKFKGVYKNAEQFKGMDNVDVTENPEVGFEVPARAGVKIGIYANSYGCEEIMKMLDSNKSFNCFFIPRLDSECLRSCEVIIIPQPRNIFFFKHAYKLLQREVTANGKKLVLTHNAASFAPELFKSFKSLDVQKIVHDKKAPVKTTKGEEFTPGFEFDNYIFSKADKFDTLVTDSGNNPVVISAKCGKGKVLLFGTLPGCVSEVGNPELKNEKMPEAESRNFQELIEKFSESEKKL